MIFRRATQEDVEAFVKHRVEFATIIRTINDVMTFEKNTLDYVNDHMNKEDFLVYLAVEDGKIVASCMACIFQVVPLPACPKGKMAELLNVYTTKDYRRQGLSKTLLTQLLAALKEQGVEKVLLEATEMGLPLYQKLGFQPVDNHMALIL